MGSHKFDEIRTVLDQLEDEAEKMSNDLDRAIDNAEDAMEEAKSEIAWERDALARELEPIFGAIFASDIDRAKGAVRELHAMLRGDDPIIVAIQRAKSRPHHYLASAA